MLPLYFDFDFFVFLLLFVCFLGFVLFYFLNILDRMTLAIDGVIGLLSMIHSSAKVNIYKLVLVFPWGSTAYVRSPTMLRTCAIEGHPIKTLHQDLKCGPCIYSALHSCMRLHSEACPLVTCATRCQCCSTKMTLQSYRWSPLLDAGYPSKSWL